MAELLENVSLILDRVVTGHSDTVKVLKDGLGYVTPREFSENWGAQYRDVARIVKKRWAELENHGSIKIQYEGIDEQLILLSQNAQQVIKWGLPGDCGKAARDNTMANHFSTLKNG